MNLFFAAKIQIKDAMNDFMNLSIVYFLRRKIFVYLICSSTKKVVCEVLIDSIYLHNEHFLSY